MKGNSEIDRMETIQNMNPRDGTMETIKKLKD